MAEQENVGAPGPGHDHIPDTDTDGPVENIHVHAREVHITNTRDLAGHAVEVTVMNVILPIMTASDLTTEAAVVLQCLQGNATRETGKTQSQIVALVCLASAFTLRKEG